MISNNSNNFSVDGVIPPKNERYTSHHALRGHPLTTDLLTAKFQGLNIRTTLHAPEYNVPPFFLPIGQGGHFLLIGPKNLVEDVAIFLRPGRPF